MTEEEHQARAMLMGYKKYVASFGYYINYNSPRTVSGIERIDAETLEFVDASEAAIRQNTARKRWRETGRHSWYTHD